MSELKDDEVSLEDNSASGDLADELHVDHTADIDEARGHGSQSYVQSDNSLTNKHKKKRKRPKYAKRDFPSDSSESESEDYSHRRKNLRPQSMAEKVKHPQRRMTLLPIPSRTEKTKSKNDKHLFGNEFKEELKEWSKTKKEASEMALALGGKKKSHKKKSLNLVTLSKQFPIAGRLKHFVKNWEIITSDKKILKDIQNVEITFQSHPIQLKDPRMTVLNQKEKHLMSTEVKEMLTKEVIVPVKPCKDQFLSNWFLVPKKDGGQRPVLNLKQYNEHVIFMLKIDLKEAHLVLSICQNHRKFLSFKWEETLFEYTALPFGLAEGPRLLTKIMKPVIEWGHKIKRFKENNEKHVELVSGKEDKSHCRAPPRERKSYSRLALEKNKRLQRLESRSKYFQQVQDQTGPLEIDVFASRLNFKLKKYCELETRSNQSCDRRISDAMDNNKRLPLPPFSMIGRCLSKSRKDKATLLVIAPAWQAQPWYPMLLEMLIQDPIKISKSFDVTQGETTPTDSNRVSQSCGMENFSGQSTTEELSKAAELHEKAWRPGT
ncbi:unnamed protein product [Mytilus edulis]|uniref:Uncharacterized protein n=1 Tax=Mytilus edulis TaxID=6550 RepID=A0A8S3VAV2_MYTED|nr:unnamed protein product [Mytilus edulis]